MWHFYRWTYRSTCHMDNRRWFLHTFIRDYRGVGEFFQVREHFFLGNRVWLRPEFVFRMHFRVTFKRQIQLRRRRENTIITIYFRQYKLNQSMERNEIDLIWYILNYLRITIDETFRWFNAHDLFSLLSSDFIRCLYVGDFLTCGHHSKSECYFKLILVRRVINKEPVEFPMFTVVECAEIELRRLIAIRVN